MDVYHPLNNWHNRPNSRRFCGLFILFAIKTPKTKNLLKLEIFCLQNLANNKYLSNIYLDNFKEI